MIMKFVTMKTIKHIVLLLFFVSCSTVLMATTHQSNPYASPSTSSEVFGSAVNKVSAPSMEFESTSSMPFSGTTLPNAAATGVTTADGNAPASSPRGPRRVSPDGGFGDPGADNTPLTDAVPCLLILAIGYAIYLGRKTSVPNPESRK